MGAPNHCAGDENPNNVTNTFLNTANLLPKEFRLEHGGRQTWFLPRPHLTSSRPCTKSSKRLNPIFQQLHCKQEKKAIGISNNPLYPQNVFETYTLTKASCAVAFDTVLAIPIGKNNAWNVFPTWFKVERFFWHPTSDNSGPTIRV